MRIYNDSLTANSMSTLSLDSYLEALYQKALSNVRDHVEMLYISAMSKERKESKKQVDETLVEIYLKKRGYTMNYILERRVMVKDFTCVIMHKDYVEIWHDKAQNNKSVFIDENLLTGLPAALNYMERL